ncbi:MAG: LamG-like jellyroll fold domain-containing protein, partial [Gammaproteobacteria bacterium]
ALRGAGAWYSASCGAVAPNSWTHLAGTYDGETLRAYRNGVLISENYLPSGPPDSESAALLIGRNATVAHYFAGDADDVRIYSRALTGMELAELIAVPPDTEAPVISNVAAAPFGTTAVVSWTTDEPGDSRVTYGEDMNLGAVESDASRVVDHAVTLVGLAPSTTYFYKVTSTDGSANTVTDDNGGAMYSFTTSQSGGAGEPDADLDGMSDAWEGQWGFDPNDPADAGLDADGDGITNLEEYQAGTHPLIVFPGNAWQTRTPSQADLDPVILDEFVAAVGGDGVIVRNGYIVRSWGDIASSGGSWWSSSKPVLSTMLLFAVNEGLLGSSADPISDFVPGLLPMDQGITFGHLAQNTSGYMLAEGPGAAWSYNDYGINLFLKALYLGVFNEAGGLNPADAALTSARRLGALRFQDGNLYSPWQDGGWEIGASVRDFARIGMFWLHEGQWDGDQLLSRDMFRQYARPGIGQDFPLSSGVLDPNGDYLGVGSNGGAAGDLLDLMDGNGGRGIYGMHWWFNGQPATRTTRLWPDVQGDAFGAFAGTRSSMVVFPGLDMVYAGRQTTIGLNEVTRNATFKRLMDAAGVPARPTGLIGMPQGLELVALDWDDSPDPGVAGYNVYRAQASGGPFTRRNAQPIVASDFIDTQTVQGESYYMVTAVTVDGIESACSNELPVVSNTSGLVVHYPLDEGGGVTAFDASGNGNDATLAQGAAWSAGPFGDALSFDGLGAELQTGFSSHLPVYTVSAWVRSPSAPLPGPPNGPVHREDNFVISWDHPAAEFRGAMALSVAGEWYAASFGSLAPDTWMHLAGTYDGETLRAYRDGVLITANPAPSGPADAEFAPLSVGKNATSPGYFEGDIDEVRIYNRVLSDAEIGELAR